MYKINKIIFIALLLVMLFDSVYTIDANANGVILRFGRYSSTQMPGLHFKIPYVDSVEILEIRTRKNLEKLNASTHEQMPVTAEVSINWTVKRTELLRR